MRNDQTQSEILTAGLTGSTLKFGQSHGIPLCNFSKSILSSHAQKNIIDIREGQNQVKVIQGYQVHYIYYYYYFFIFLFIFFFEKCIFGLPCIEKIFQTSGKVKNRSRSLKVIKFFLTSHAQQKNILDIGEDHNRFPTTTESDGATGSACLKFSRYYEEEIAQTSDTIV